jgi:hypothetical protein
LQQEASNIELLRQRLTYFRTLAFFYFTNQ